MPAWNVYQHHTMGCVLPQERKANITTIQPAEAKTATIYRRIGSTTYKVRVHFSETGEETINDKILHLEQSAKRYSVTSAGKPTLTIRRSNQVKSMINRESQLVLDTNTPFTQDGFPL